MATTNGPRTRVVVTVPAYVPPVTPAGPTDGPRTRVVVTVPEYQPPVIPSGPTDGPRTRVVVTVPAGNNRPSQNGPRTRVVVTVLPNKATHRPIVVVRGGGLARIRIVTYADLHGPHGPVATFRSARAQARTRPVGVVFAGSSSTQGTGASTAANRYVNRLVAMLQAANPNGGAESTVAASASATFTKKTTPGIHGYNLGQGGATAANFFTEEERTAVAALAPDAVFIMIGSNDSAYNMAPSTTYRNNLTTVLNDLRSKIPGVMLFLLHSYERMDGPFTFPWAAYRTVLEEIAAASPSDTYAIDASGPFIAQGVPGADPNDLIGTDNIHPTNAGHLLLAQTILAAL